LWGEPIFVGEALFVGEAQEKQTNKQTNKQTKRTKTNEPKTKHFFFFFEAKDGRRM
jgi:hypothetical protein